jgi:hypothetical protein
MRPRSRAGLPAAVGVALLAGVATSNPLAAQGIRLDLTAFVVRPNLDTRSGEVFARLGRFRAGIGADLGVGYDVRQFGATLSGGFAGVEIGAPVTRDGIDMGRESGIYRSIALLGHWRPRRRIGRWRPVFSGLSDGREPTRAVGPTPGGRRSSLNAGRGTRARAGRGNMSGHRG